MMRKVHIAFVLALIALGGASLYGANPASVTGVVRDSAGVPQMGAVVQLLRADSSVLTLVYTNSKGHFTIPAVAPGRYSLKVICTSFLPTMRENVRVRSNTVVNLTLNTLYEVMQWLPAQPRSASAPQDDWAWTLRSAANRPLLRWLEDGPLVVVSDGRHSRPRLMARIMATGQQGAFGESGQRITASIENTPSDSRELLARVDFAPGSNADMEAMLGFSQDLGFSGSVQTVAAVALRPEVEGPGDGGIDEAAFRTWETVNLGDEFTVEAGSEQVLARAGSASPNTVAAALPFAAITWHAGDNSLHYSMTTLQQSADAQDPSAVPYWLPAVGARNGALVLERGVHQELGWKRDSETSQMAVAVFADHIVNPVLEAAARIEPGSEMLAGADLLYDRQSGLMRAVAGNYTSTGVQASVEHRMAGGNRMRLSYANADALAISSTGRGTTLAQAVASVHPRRVQTYALALSGTLEGTGTRWRASYRWQPEDTVTQTAPFAEGAAEPYLTLHFRQPIGPRHEGGTGIEALLDVRNLLAEGYRPFMSGDGSLLVFAQQQRCIRGGFAITF